MLNNIFIRVISYAIKYLKIFHASHPSHLSFCKLPSCKNNSINAIFLFYITIQIIRSQNSSVNNKTIPIIALTADAFIETKKKVLEAGMNDFVTKPIDQEELYSKIIKQIKK